MNQFNHFVSSNFVKIKSNRGYNPDLVYTLTLAKALVNQNIYVDMFVKKKSNIINSSRTLGISKSNVEFYNKNIVNKKHNMENQKKKFLIILKMKN